jgi:hypothetical protein
MGGRIRHIQPLEVTLRNSQLEGEHGMSEES